MYWTVGANLTPSSLFTVKKIKAGKIIFSKRVAKLVADELAVQSRSSRDSAASNGEHTAGGTVPYPLYC